MGRNKELVKNTIILLVGKVLTQFLSFFLIPLYTYMLPAAEYGEVDLIMTYITLLVPVITIQQEMATFRHLVDARGDGQISGQIIKTSIKSAIMRLLIFCIPYALVVSIIHWKYGILVLFCGVFTAMANLFLQIARGFGDNVRYAIGSVIAGIITILLNLIFICGFKLGGGSILAAMAIANFCAGAYLFFALNIPKYLRKTKSSKEVRNKMLKYSWPLVPNGISWWLINASDRTIVSLFLGVAANGIYAVVVKIPSIIGSFLGIFSLSWTESASVHINDKDRDEFFSSVANNTLRIFSGLSALVIAFVPLIFDTIIGYEYRSAYEYIPIAILAVFMNCLVSVYSAIYVAKKMTKQVATTSFIAAVINLVVDLVLIHFIGLYAAVISTAVAYLSMAIYRHYDLKKYVKIRYRGLDLLLAVIALVVVSAIYYSNNYILFVIGLVLAIVYSAVQNRNLVGKILKRFLSRKK